MERIERFLLFKYLERIYKTLETLLKVSEKRLDEADKRTLDEIYWELNGLVRRLDAEVHQENDC